MISQFSTNKDWHFASNLGSFFDFVFSSLALLSGLMKRALPILLLASFFSAAIKLHAVLMKPLPITDLAQSAELIVHGTVVGKTCHRDEAGRIYTKIELNVFEFWKGSAPGATLTIFQGGGSIGNERVEVSGEAEYQVGEEVVAFLVLNPRGQPITFALGQGKFHVW